MKATLKSERAKVPRRRFSSRQRTSRFMGVGSSNRKNQWQARILVHGKVRALPAPQPILPFGNQGKFGLRTQMPHCLCHSLPCTIRAVGYPTPAGFARHGTSRDVPRRLLMAPWQDVGIAETPKLSFPQEPHQ